MISVKRIFTLINKFAVTTEAVRFCTAVINDDHLTTIVTRYFHNVTKRRGNCESLQRNALRCGASKGLPLDGRFCQK